MVAGHLSEKKGFLLHCPKLHQFRWKEKNKVDLDRIAGQGKQKTSRETAHGAANVIHAGGYRKAGRRAFVL